MITIRIAEIANNRERLRRKIANDPVLDCLGVGLDRVRATDDGSLPAPSGGLGLLLSWPPSPIVYEHVLVDACEVRVLRPALALSPVPQSPLLDRVERILSDITPREQPVLRVVRGERRTDHGVGGTDPVLVGRFKVLARRTDPGSRSIFRIIIPPPRRPSSRQ